MVIQERIDRKLYVMDGQRELRYREVLEPAKRQAEIEKKAVKTWKPPAPGMGHPLKRKSFERVLRLQAMKTARIQSERGKLCV